MPRTVQYSTVPYSLLYTTITVQCTRTLERHTQTRQMAAASAPERRGNDVVRARHSIRVQYSYAHKRTIRFDPVRSGVSAAARAVPRETASGERSGRRRSDRLVRQRRTCAVPCRTAPYGTAEHSTVQHMNAVCALRSALIGRDEPSRMTRVTASSSTRFRDRPAASSRAANWFGTAQ